MSSLKNLNIVQVKSSSAMIDWHMGNTCQNACSYCDPCLHIGDATNPTLDQMKKLVIAAEEKFQFTDGTRSIKFAFSGGEPTINTNFGSFVQWLKERGHRITVITNGGRTLRWWKEWGHYLDFVIFSYHTEFTDIEHFYEIVEYQSSLEKGVAVHLIAWPALFEKIVSARQRLLTIPNCSIIVKKIIDDWVPAGVTMEPYTPEQLTWINDNFSKGSTSNPFNDKLYVYTDTQQRIRPHGQEIRHYGKNKFYGWNCRQGFKNLSINAYGDIYAAHCRQLKLGHLSDVENLAWPKTESVCKFISCHCATDYVIDKSAPNIKSQASSKEI